MKQSILATWSVARIARLLIGIMALVRWFINWENIMFFAGCFLVVTAIVNVGCTTNSCPVPSNTNKSLKIEKLDNQ